MMRPLLECVGNFYDLAVNETAVVLKIFGKHALYDGWHDFFSF